MAISYCEQSQAAARLREAQLMGFRRLTLYPLRRLQQRRSGWPGTVTVEASSRCNLRCSFCVTTDRRLADYRAEPFLSLPLFRNLVDDIAGFCTHLHFSLYGEPLLNPELPDMIAYAESRGLFTTLFTNSTLLDEAHIQSLLDAGLTRIIASLESFDPEVYESTKCGARLDEVHSNIARLIKMRNESGRRRPEIVLRTVVTQLTREANTDYERRAAELGADVISMKPLTVWPQADEAFKDNIKDQLAVSSEVSRYEKDEHGKLALRARPARCLSMRTPAVLSDGSVCACWYDSLAETKIGNLHVEPFRQIWQRGREARQARMKSGSAYSFCQECPGIGADRHLTLVKT